jgi:methionyl-tRNA formyltransferase
VTQPYPGAFTETGGKKLFVWWAKPVAGQHGEPGQVVSVDPLVIATGSGSIELVNYEWEDEAAHELKPGLRLGMETEQS